MNNGSFPVVKSFLAEKYIAQEIEKAYNLPGVGCQLSTAFMHF